MNASLEADLYEQPSVLARLLGEGRALVEPVAARVRACAPAFVVLAARGSSDNAARYGQYVLGIRNGLVAALAAPSIFTRYGAAPDLARALVVGISQSGQSPDVVGVVRKGRRQGAVTLTITNDVASPLAQSAELVLPLMSGPERAVPATKTYTGELMALAMLSAALGGGGSGGNEEPWRELQAVPGMVARAIETSADRAPAAARFRQHTRMVVVGRGYNLSTVFEIALKLKEAPAVMADPYSSADLLHGPVVLLDRGLPVMVVAPSGAVSDDLEDAIVLARERGARLLIISDSPALLEMAEVPLPLPAGIPEWLSPLVAVVPGQLFAQALARARGMRPDSPPGLSKITLTR